VIRVGWQALVAVLAVASCAAPVPPNITFPRYEPTGSGPEALLDAELVRVGSCLALDSGNGVLIALWPSSYGARFNHSGVVIVTGGLQEPLVAEGDSAQFGGGGLEPEVVEDLVGTLPSDCAADGYWLVTTVQGA
jgi:hypothetical protein